MPRLPIVGDDENTWGDILNEYLLVEHNADGTQKTVPVGQGGTGATSSSQALSNLGGITDDDAQALVDTHVNDATGAHAATSISFTPAGSIASTTMQSVLEELDAEKQALSEKDQADGYAALDATRRLNPLRLPPQARIYFADQAASYDASLTSAVGDYTTDDWAAIDGLVSWVSANGGGRVVLTAGKTYGIEGPGGDTSPHGIRLRDNIELWLNGATIKAKGNKNLNPGLIAHKDYDYVADRVSVTGTTVKNAAIIGPGVIDGNVAGGQTRGVVGIRIDGFEHLRIIDVTVQDTNSYGVAFQARADGADGNLSQEHLHLRGCSFLSVGLGTTPRDALDAKSGRRWWISDCFIDGTGDAGINVRVEDCFISDILARNCGGVGFRFQRVAFGFGGGTSGTVSIHGQRLFAVDCVDGFDINGIQAISGQNPATEEINVHMTDCMALGCTSDGLTISTGENLDLFIDGFYAIDCTTRGVDIAVAVAGQQFRIGRFSRVVCRGNGSDGVRSAGGNSFWEHCDFVGNGGSGFNETGVRTNFPNSAIDNVMDTETCRTGTDNGNAAADVSTGHIVTSANTIWMPKGSLFGKRTVRIDGTASIGTINGVSKGERIHLWANGAWTLARSSTMHLDGGVNFVAATHNQIGLLKTDTAFKEIYRSLSS